MTFDYNENLLQFIWEYQLFKTQHLTTLSGDTLTILRQGVLNKNSGPDFENAHIKLEKTELFGSIEIHINERDWLAHNHQKDKAYNNVILHVCFSASSPVYREDGTKIPTLVLEDKIDLRYLKKYQNLLESQHFIPCENKIKEIEPFDIENWLDRMTVERIEARCVLLNNYLEQTNNNWTTTFYISLVRAFGMPINTSSFEELALKIPHSIIQKHNNSLFQLEALLFGVAGLLDETNQENYYVSLQNEFSFLQKKYTLKPITQKLKMGKMRPLSLPYIRLAQLAALFHNLPNWSNEIIWSSSYNQIKNQLRFDLSNFWLTHYTFKKSSNPRQKFLAKSFINHLFINSIIPFVFLYKTKKFKTDPAKSLSYLEDVPSEKNQIIYQWKRIGIKSKSAHNSQALLHLYQTYCQNKDCLNCNIGRKILLNK